MGTLTLRSSQPPHLWLQLLRFPQKGLGHGARHGALCHQITCQLWTAGIEEKKELKKKKTFTTHTLSQAHAHVKRWTCQHTLSASGQKQRVTVIEFTAMLSAKQPSWLWQIGRPSGPISPPLISVHILTSASDVNSRALKGGYEPWSAISSYQK